MPEFLRRRDLILPLEQRVESVESIVHYDRIKFFASGLRVVNANRPVEKVVSNLEHFHDRAALKCSEAYLGHLTSRLVEAQLLPTPEQDPR